jgi:type I restriction enzyme, R subunit
MPLYESHVEEAALEWLAQLGCEIAYGPHIAPGEPAAERGDFGEVVLASKLRAAVDRINHHIPREAQEEAVRKVLAASHDAPGLTERNRRFHQMLLDGIDVEVRGADGQARFEKVRLVDNLMMDRNEFLAVNQFNVVENNINRRPDIVVFVNGIPLGVIELKNAADENATTKSAFKQFETYKAEIGSLMTYSEVLVISDGLQARAGTLSSDFERFQPWRTVYGDVIAPLGELELKTLILGIFEKHRFLDLVNHFVVFESDGHGSHVKKMAAYHQFHAVNKAVQSTVEAASERGDRRAGVIWHTQGSGKSLSMVFYTGKIVRSPAMANPTIVVITDRNDLDDQLFGTFASCRDVFRQTPVQALGRDHLREQLRVASGGVVFTTLQKFMPDGPGSRYPMLSDRRNIVVIADEAHRSQYNFKARTITTGAGLDMTYGFAQHVRDALPYASFIGFTGTPIEKADRSTRKVFGDYIDVYDIQRSVEDGATVPLYYEARLARLELDENERPHIDEDFEDVTEDVEEDVRRQVASKWARTEALVGATHRIALVAADIVDHFEKRRDAMDGKGMIVCMSRRIAVELYDAIVKLRPAWQSNQDDHGFVKVVMTGSAADGDKWQKHIRTKERRGNLAEAFKKPDTEFKLAIVRDMWLTGFDAPSAHTMYVDKPMCGHGLMQAIARVNRVFKDKPGGLIVDYLGIADRLKQALNDYTEGDREEVAIPIEKAVAAMQERYEVVCAMFHGFDYSVWSTGTAAQRLALLPQAMQHILGLDANYVPAENPDDQTSTSTNEGSSRFLSAVISLTRAFALSMPEQAALDIREDIAFFHAVRSGLVKTTVTGGKSTDDIDTAVRQIVSKAVASTEIIDIFRAAGLKTPDISILSAEFLSEMQGMPQKNLAFEFLRKLLNDEIKKQAKTNVIQSKLFSEKLEEAILRYQNRAIDAAQIVTELIDMAKEINAARARNEELGLTPEELAFYDALGTNDSAVQALGDENLRIITRALVECVHENAGIDWTERETVRANMRRMVKRILRKYGYPPDKADWAVKNIIEQAEALTAQVVA